MVPLPNTVQQFIHKHQFFITSIWNVYFSSPKKTSNLQLSGMNKWSIKPAEKNDYQWLMPKALKHESLHENRGREIELTIRVQFYHWQGYIYWCILIQLDQKVGILSTECNTYYWKSAVLAVSVQYRFTITHLQSKMIYFVKSYGIFACLPCCASGAWCMVTCYCNSTVSLVLL